MNRIRNLPLLTLLMVLAAAVVLPSLLDGGDALAQSGGDTARGWTVWQNGAKVVYPEGDGWSGSANPSGFTLRNSNTAVEVLYFGTFKVEHRERDLD